ncbi:hypothetical protein [Collinsella tanakaei]|uniref:hypothetical protein n=1 Tax=Collinsella tanakaei TaxID=626935 RepID=UPI0026EA0945|nr:hypothetical protein [Collinsella tanakaei]
MPNEASAQFINNGHDRQVNAQAKSTAPETSAWGLARIPRKGQTLQAVYLQVYQDHC